MPTSRGLYLSWDKASKYLARIGIGSIELSALSYRKVNGAQREELVIYLADDILRLAHRLRPTHPLPDLNYFLTPSQVSRHKAEQAKYKEIVAHSRLLDHMADRLNSIVVQKVFDLEDEEDDMVESYTELKRTRC